MHIELYADILFLINFFMLFVIFFIVNNFMKIRVSLKRILINAFITAISYVLIIIYIPFYKNLNIIVILSLIILSIIICFKINNIKEFFRIFLMVNIVSFFIGGFSIALYYMAESNINYINNTINNFSFKILLITVFCTYIILKFGLKCYKNIIIKNQVFYNLVLHNNNNKISINSLLDTGNSLKEPISQKPVIIAEFLAIKDILPNSIKILFYEKQENNLEKILENSTGVDIRFIPFKSIGEENGLLLGIKIDKLEIIDLDNKNNNIVIRDVIVAICNFSLSKDNFYNGLLNPEMLK